MAYMMRDEEGGLIPASSHDHGAFDYYSALYSEQESTREPDVFNMTFASMSLVEKCKMMSRQVPTANRAIWAIVNAAIDDSEGIGQQQCKVFNRQEFLQTLCMAVVVYVSRYYRRCLMHTLWW